MTGPPAVRPVAAATWSARGPLLLGLAVSTLLALGLGLWAARATIAGAVIAPGELRVETERKTVSHLEGGVVAEILVREGDRVTAGQPLLRLDATALKARIEIVASETDALLARAARLRAERDDAVELAPDPAADPALAARLLARPAAAEALHGQIRLFAARRDTLTRQQAQLRARIAQYGDEIAGAQAQIAALGDQLDLIEEELVDHGTLLAKGLTPKSRVTALRRERASLAGERGARLAEVAQARGRIAEAELRLLELAAQRRETAITELREIAVRLGELRERGVALREQLGRTEIRAPRAGWVLDLSAHTIGGVIAPMEPVLQIVPEDEALVLIARVDALDRDRVRPGQPAAVKFPGFNQRTTPEIAGAVARISGDALIDPQTGSAFYAAELRIPPPEIARLTAALGAELAPGMPAEVYIATERRSAASWLLKPLTDSFDRAFREE